MKKFDGTTTNWCTVDTSEYNILLKIFGNIKMFKDVPSRKIYEYFLTNLQQLYSLVIRDGYDSFDFSKQDIKHIFLRPRTSTLILELREFQFKLLHGVMYTNEQLLKFGFVADDLCTFCKQSTETYSHLFWNCTKIQSLWQEIIDEYNLFELRNVDWQDIHVGIEVCSPRIKFCNTLILMIKYMIYRARSKLAIPSIGNVKKTIIEYRDEEKSIAEKGSVATLHVTTVFSAFALK